MKANVNDNVSVIIYKALWKDYVNKQKTCIFLCIKYLSHD